MHVGHSHIVTEYILCDNSGECVELTHEKDIGVWITSHLKSSLPCSKAVASAMTVLSMIFGGNYNLYFFVLDICEATFGILHICLEPQSC